MIRRTILALVVALAGILTVTTEASAAPPPSECGGDCPPEVGKLPDGYRYTYSAGTQTIYRVNGLGGTEPVGQQVFRFEYQPACAGNVPGSPQGGDNLCAFALTQCPEPMIALWRWHQEVLGGLPTGPWLQDLGVRCLQAAVAYPLDDLRATFADYLREQHLPEADLRVQPLENALVNLPIVFSTTPHEPRTVDVDVPLPAQLRAEPHWAWSFGDGAIGRDWPGLPYDPAVSPTRNPGHYLSHAYRDTTPRTAQLTVTWSGVFVVPGIAVEFDLDPVVFTAAQAIAPREARAELVADG